MIELNKKLNTFELILSSFKVKYKNINIVENKYYDIYDIELEDGFHISKLKRLLPDIGIKVRAKNIPHGKIITSDGVYRIHIQKQDIITVPFNDIFAKPEKMLSPILIGISNDGDTMIKDLALLPNLLVAGIPGSGKSVLLHSIILSLISSNADIYIADPKFVEYGIYKNIKQVKAVSNDLLKIQEDIKNINIILNDRFERLAKVGARNIYEYNIKSKSKFRPISIIIDEWADIVLQAPSIQKDLCLIAQKGRAAGISIVLATQRPSTDIISGVIKANFPARICMRVSSQTDSKVVLDRGGGQNILNIGEGLYIDHSISEPILFKAPFISDPSKILDAIPNTKIGFWERLWR